MDIRTSLRLAALFSAGALSCGAEPPESVSEPVASESSAIVNGGDLNQFQTQFYGTVAIYHPEDGFTWFPRPCSGTMFSAQNGFTWILTARHCVTTNGAIGGPLANPSQLRVIPGPHPGLANPNPPAAAVPAAFVWAMTPTKDMALVGVQKNWEPIVTRFGTWLTEPNKLFQRQATFTAFGYGLNVFDLGCFDHVNPVNTNAGHARYGSAFTVASGGTVSGPNEEGSFYQYVNTSTNGQSTICGDSGGGDIAPLGQDQGSIWLHLLGVHSTGTQAPNELASSQTSIRFLQSFFGGFYLSPDRYGTVPRGILTGANANVTRAPTGNGLTLATSPTPGDRWGYDPFTQRISLSASTNTCLAPTGGAGSSVVQAQCSSATAQRWTFEASRRIVNVAHGTCLTTSGSSLSTALCDDSSPNSWTQMWAFHPQPYDYEAYTYCSEEYQNCSFSGTRNVRYGENGAYFYRTLTNGAACSNATFGDPIPGVVKKCWIGPKNFTHCAAQNGTCTFAGQKLVAYGANNNFYYKMFNGSAPCTVGAFDGDPIVGVVKDCYVGG